MVNVLTLIISKYLQIKLNIKESFPVLYHKKNSYKFEFNQNKVFLGMKTSEA